MRVLMVLALSAVSVCGEGVATRATAGDAKDFELQGDKLGESYAIFISRHPKAVCEKSTETRANCYQWVDVSIFGLQAHPGPGCSLKTYSAEECVQGLSAQFKDGQLISLSYAVAGTDKKAPTAELKQLFGTPEIDTSEATIWQRGRAFASVVVGRAAESNGGPILITFSISNA